jgi:hypothetical protein
MQGLTDPTLEKKVAVVPYDGRLSVESPLFLATKKHLSQSKVTIGSRIVVVAGSSYAYSTLETLCFVPHLNFTNIYVVIEKPPAPFLLECGGGTDNQGSEEGKHGDERPTSLSVHDVDDPLESDLYALGIAFRCTIVLGRLTDIDRGNRAIVVSDELIVEYDVLLISSPSQGKH